MIAGEEKKQLVNNKGSNSSVNFFIVNLRILYKQPQLAQ
ncbi:hypothetical protein MNB_SUP05-SYMBIONT-5-1149 [hydrothermal vent metagenome]|uniref:Uncharacterized protein n=1 Tax=hydrothermal vent metagenome TaxID=652676 RepID=A0A1W1E0Y8_9ZZZZ